MAEAHDIIEEAKGALAVIDGKIRSHPAAVAVATGEAEQSALQFFCGNQYQMWKPNADARSVAMFRFAEHPYSAVFLTPPEIEDHAAQAFSALGQCVGLKDPDGFEPSAGAFGYAAYKAWLICYASAAEIACARALNLAAWGHNCALMSSGLRSHYGLRPADTAFLDGFSALPAQEKSAADVIEHDLKRGVDPRLILRAARMMQAYELMFWDAMAEAGGIGASQSKPDLL
ncbi:MAG: hypothetical protein AAF724_21560 [Pseudomonadota bacterium]